MFDLRGLRSALEAILSRDRTNVLTTRLHFEREAKPLLLAELLSRFDASVAALRLISEQIEHWQRDRANPARLPPESLLARISELAAWAIGEVDKT